MSDIRGEDREAGREGRDRGEGWRGGMEEIGKGGNRVIL